MAWTFSTTMRSTFMSSRAWAKAVASSMPLTVLMSSTKTGVCRRETRRWRRGRSRGRWRRRSCPHHDSAAAMSADRDQPQTSARTIATSMSPVISAASSWARSRKSRTRASIGVSIRPASCASENSAGAHAPGTRCGSTQPCTVSAPGGKNPLAISFSVVGPTPPSFSMMSRTFQTGGIGRRRWCGHASALSVLHQFHGLEVGLLEEGRDGLLAEGLGRWPCGRASRGRRG